MRCLLLVALSVFVGSVFAQSPGITGTVSVTPELALQLSGKDVVYIYARDSDTRKLTLATVRTWVGELPLHFVLNDALAPSPERRLSNFSRVDVIARVSRNPADAHRGPDMMGTVAGIGNQSSGVELAIDTLMVCAQP